MDIRNTCLACGSGAFRGVLVYCSKCKEYAQHGYCLGVSIDEYVRRGRIWYCEDCQEVKPAASFSTHDLDECESMDTGEVLQSTPPSAGTSSTPDGTNKKLKAKNTKKLKKKSQKKKSNQSGFVVKSVLETILEGNEEAEDEGAEINCDDGHKLGNDQEGNGLQKDQFDASDDTTEIDEDGDSTHVAAQPVAIPTWRGSLNILNKVNYKNLRNETISGLAAHLSSIACAKVLEESKFLKTQLVPDLVRRTDVWPKGYDMCETSDRSIALYFFPDSETDEKDFNNLMGSMMQEDLAMRVDVENAELLVFTSSMLPKKYQRVKSKMYLWGVFKEKY
ncbi:PHD finger-containing protein 1-like [Rosa rugosa]|uniref:PHD finger-containing protein 1-like n=1 Tax=Rosa rugosa TaxID=74645 RepID=UPI002B4159CC|nr:PHD finger-containing protein 1-like [Rosa rugosa]